MSVFRIYVEKKPEFAVEAQSVLSDVKLPSDLTSQVSGYSPATMPTSSARRTSGLL